jgi:integrase
VAKKILEIRAKVADLTFSPYVFPGRDGGIRTDTGKAARRIVRAAGLPDDFRPLHGQRHAYASNLANTGRVDLYQIGQLLGHSKNSPTMTQRYSHIRDAALKQATGLMSDIVSDAVTAAKVQARDKGHKAG